MRTEYVIFRGRKAHIAASSRATLCGKLIGDETTVRDRLYTDEEVCRECRRAQGASNG